MNREMASTEGQGTATLDQTPAPRLAGGPPGPHSHARLHSLTGLRFFAALLVFAYHSSLQIPSLAVFGYGDGGHSWARVAGNAGAAGVAFFFVLSGFVLTWSARTHDTVTAFWRRRLVKIYPNYVLAWVLAMVLFASSYTPTSHAVLNLFMLQVWAPDFFLNFSVDPPSWSLGAEAFFYACFPLLLVLINKIDASKLKYWTAATVAAIFVVPFLAYAFLSETPRVPGDLNASPLQYWLVYILPPSQLLDFALGILLARLVLTGRWRNIGVTYSVLLLGASYVLTMYVPYLYAQRSVCIIPIMLLIAAAAMADASGKGTIFHGRTMRWLGDISFAFYLLHFIVLVEVMKYARQIADKQDFSVGAGVMLMVLALLITVAASALVYAFFERPITQRWSSSRRAKEARVTA